MPICLNPSHQGQKNVAPGIFDNRPVKLLAITTRKGISMSFGESAALTDN